jgi:hypothetical protein
MSAYGVQPVVSVHLPVSFQRTEHLQSGGWALDHCHGDSVVESDHCARREMRKHAVEDLYLRPIRARCAAGF